MAGTLIVEDGGAGLVIEGDIGEATSDDTPETVAEQLARVCLRRLAMGYPAAALAHAVELVNLIARENDLGGGAWL